MRHSRIRAIFLLLTAAIISLPGCGSGGGSSSSSNNNNNNSGNAGDAIVRLVNASPDSASIDLLIRNRTTAENVTYLEDTEYNNIDAGSSAFVVRDSGGFNTIEDSSRSFTKEKQYSIFVFGPFRERKAVVVEDDNSSPKQGRVRIRFVNALFSTKGVDVYIVSPRTDIGSAEPVYKNISREKITDYLESDQGQFVIRVTNKDDLNIIAESPILQFDADQVRTFILADALNGNRDLTIATLHDRE